MRISHRLELSSSGSPPPPPPPPPDTPGPDRGGSYRTGEAEQGTYSDDSDDSYDSYDDDDPPAMV